MLYIFIYIAWNKDSYTSLTPLLWPWELLGPLSEWLFDISNPEQWIHALMERYITLPLESKVHYSLYFMLKLHYHYIWKNTFLIFKTGILPHFFILYNLTILPFIYHPS